jgi:hypothetical protein
MRRLGFLLAGVLSVLLSLAFAPAAQAAPAPTKYMVVEDAVGTLGTDCTYPACGEVHNRSGHQLIISRDANSHWSCGDIGPYAVLNHGEDSNGAPRYWKDTDCFAGTDCSIYYRYTWYRPYEFIRIYNPVWVTNVSC